MKLYIVYNIDTRIVYSLDTSKPIAWTKGNIMEEIEVSSDFRFDYSYKYINNHLVIV